MQSAAARTGSAITAYLEQPAAGLVPDTRFRWGRSATLHFLPGPPTIGVGVSSFGAGVSGSVAAYFSDILGGTTSVSASRRRVGRDRHVSD